MRLKMLFKVFDERARRIALALTLTVVFAVLSGVIAAGQTVYSGFVLGWWVVAGIFVWMLVVLSVLLGLVRFQTKAGSRGEESPRVGRNYVGPMVLSGGLLVVLGIIGILNVVLVADCGADGACGSLPSEAGPVFLGCFIAGIVLLAGALGFSARGLSRGAERRGEGAV